MTLKVNSLFSTLQNVNQKSTHKVVPYLFIGTLDISLLVLDQIRWCSNIIVFISYVICLISFIPVPPIRAKIVREWTFFNAGQAYNVSCQVLGSRPPAITAIYVGPSQLREVNYHVSTHNRKLTYLNS